MGKEIAIVLAEFYPGFAKRMLEAAKKEALKRKLKIKKIIRVYGVCDVSLPIKLLLKRKDIKGVAVLGCSIKGKTAHDKVIVETIYNAVVNLSLEFNKPVSFGVIGYNASINVARQRLEEYAERAIASLDKSFKALSELR